MIKILFIFLLAFCVAAMINTRSFRARALFSKATVNIVAALALGATKQLDDGSIQTLAFLLLPAGVLVSFLWLSMHEGEEG